MRAYQIYRNDEFLCTAGIDNFDLMMAELQLVGNLGLPNYGKIGHKGFTKRITCHGGILAANGKGIESCRFWLDNEFLEESDRIRILIVDIEKGVVSPTHSTRPLDEDWMFKKISRDESNGILACDVSLNGTHLTRAGQANLEILFVSIITIPDSNPRSSGNRLKTELAVGGLTDEGEVVIWGSATELKAGDEVFLEVVKVDVCDALSSSQFYR